MKKIAIFENEYGTVEMAFKYLNIKYYNNALQFDNFPRSDSIENLKNLQDYALTIIDIDLSSQSKLDGFGLIKQIEKTFATPINILILTGQSLSKNYDNDNNLKYKYNVLEKPVNFNKLHEKFVELGV